MLKKLFENKSNIKILKYKQNIDDNLQIVCNLNKFTNDVKKYFCTTSEKIKIYNYIKNNISTKLSVNDYYKILSIINEIIKRSNKLDHYKNISELINTTLLNMYMKNPEYQIKYHNISNIINTIKNTVFTQ